MPHKFFDPIPGDMPYPHHSATPISFIDPATKGVWAGGEIIEIDTTHFVINLATKEIATWPDTTIPRPMLKFIVITGEGNRSLWIPKEKLYTAYGQPYLGTRYLELRLAMEAVGQPEELPSVGGYLWMRWVGTANEPFPRKLWEVKYELPREKSCADC